LVQDLSNYVLALKQVQVTPSEPTTVPQSKKRKLEETVAANGSAAGWADRSVRADFTAPDISFSVPQRKKLRLEWVASSSGDPQKGGIRAVDAGGDIEFGVAWKDIGMFMRFPLCET
jgi:hypothetical protein